MRPNRLRHTTKTASQGAAGAEPTPGQARDPAGHRSRPMGEVNPPPRTPRTAPGTLIPRRAPTVPPTQRRAHQQAVNRPERDCASRCLHSDLAQPVEPVHGPRRQPPRGSPAPAHRPSTRLSRPRRPLHLTRLGAPRPPLGVPRLMPPRRHQAHRAQDDDPHITANRAQRHRRPGHDAPPPRSATSSENADTTRHTTTSGRPGYFNLKYHGSP